MISMIWVVIFVALTGTHCGYGLPVRPTPQDYPHDGHTLDGWGADGGLYAAIPALALVITAIVLIFGCTWCYRHKDCKPNEGTDNQLFTASAQHLHNAQRIHPPDSGFSEPANNNISEDNNNGPISLREMQNIANNNAAAYIVSENEERNRVSRESVVEFEPLPTGFIGADPLEHCADWFGGEDFPRNNLQYLREIGRGWFGRVVEGEIEEAGSSTTVAVKILNQNATLEDKARFLDESRVYRDVRHEHILAFIGACLQEDPWILIFELCSMDLQQYLTVNRPKMAILNESGVPLQLMCDVTAALSYLHSRGYTYGGLWGGAVAVRGADERARAVLGQYAPAAPPAESLAPELQRRAPATHTTSSEIWSLGALIWEVCSWGSLPTGRPSPPPDLPCPYKSHLYQVMQLCWHADPSARPTAEQVHALISHLHNTHTAARGAHGDDNANFEERWQRLKPNSIPKIDEHVAIIHAPSTSSHFTEEFDTNTLSVDMDTAVSRSSSILSDRDPLSTQIKSESLTNLHGSLEDVRNIYLTHNETPALDCHQGNILEDAQEKDQDRSDASMDPWLKDIIAGSQDDVSYYKDVSDVIKNLDNILNSEKTSSSESSHQASPSRDNLSLDCKKEYPLQSSLVKSPGITNFQNILDTGFAVRMEDGEPCLDDEVDRDTIGTLSHSFERHSDSTSQHTLENLTPDTPMKDVDVFVDIESQINRTKVVEVGSQIKDVTVVDIESEIKQTGAGDIVTHVVNVDDENVDKKPQTKDTKVNDIERLITEIKDTVVDESQIKGMEVVDVENEIKNTHNIYSEIELATSDAVDIEFLLKNTQLVDSECAVKDTKVSDSECEIKSTPILDVECQTKSTEVVDVESPKKDDTVLIFDSQIGNEETGAIENQLKDTEIDYIVCQKNNTVVVDIESPKKDAIVSNNDNQAEYMEAENIENEIKKTKVSDFQSKIKGIEDISNENQTQDSNNIDIEKQIKETTAVDTEIKESEIAELEKVKEAVLPAGEENEKPVEREMPKGLVDSNVPKLKELCVATMPSVSENGQSLVRKDCQTPCDNVTEIRTDNDEAKSIYDIREIAGSTPLEQTEAPESVENKELIDTKVQEILPVSADEATTSNEGVDTLPSVTDDVSSTTLENDTYHIKLEDVGPASIESENNYSKDETILISDLADTITDSSKDEHPNNQVIMFDVEVDIEPITPEQTPVSVQSKLDNILKPTNFKGIEKDDSEIVPYIEIMPTHLPPEIVQNTDKLSPVPETDSLGLKEIVEANNENLVVKDSETKDMPRSDSYVVEDNKERSDGSTVYMDLINNTNSQILKDSTIDNSVKHVEVKDNTGVDKTPAVNDYTLSENESTVYLDLPSLEVIKKTNEFLQMEKSINSKHVHSKLFASTPITSDNSEVLDSTVENVPDETVVFETKVPERDPGTSANETKSEHKDTMSPFESPSHRSHQTDTYDENSSVVLGPFESTMEVFKVPKSNIEPVELPREELLAFSSNFSEMNLETPSPLRDGNFLNEVPDIISDDIQFDDLASISEPKLEAEAPSDDTGSGSGTQKRVSPSTPPNSPGIFLASTSQQKYLVDIDLSSDIAPEPDSPSLRSIDLNQIELQITSKMAMAENENNLNIEYSGPLTVEGLIEEGGAMRESDAIPESYLAGNGGSVEDIREELSLDEECVKALRNELELKLPLAQVAAIEPQCESDGEWQPELPPPPELVVSYPGALSPIQEETGQQLSAYENDINWNPSTRTDSSESYPEPCNSTESASELPCRDTCTALDLTYTLPRPDARPASQPELTMSADSLNASPRKTNDDRESPLSPVDDRTYVKESRCERISQVSPCLVSPTTDTSGAGDATRGSTLSRTTLPTDARLHSKPAETQGLSKATSIDSWCSNDTLYNVEENFDDLALDADLPEYEPPPEHSDSSDTLTREDRASPCETYVVHDSASDRCDTFSPDSITAHNHTYTKATSEPAPELAYAASFAHCTAQVAATREDAWRLPELVRKSPTRADRGHGFSPPKPADDKEPAEYSSPRLPTEPRLGRMESVEISCLQDNDVDGGNRSDADAPALIVIDDSPRYNYRNMAPSVTSTPFDPPADGADEADPIPLTLPDPAADTSEGLASVPNFHSFQLSAEDRPQDLACRTIEELASQESEALLEAESKTLSRNSNRDSLIVSDRTPTYSDFESSAVCKPQDVDSRDGSSQSGESGISSEELRRFESSLRFCPQDLSSPIDASSLLLQSERLCGGPPRAPPPSANLIESHRLADAGEPPAAMLINFDTEDETEQPHSIIVTEVPMSSSKLSPNRTYDSHVGRYETNFDHTYDSHEGTSAPERRKSDLDQLKIIKSSDRRKSDSDHSRSNGVIVDEQPESLIIIDNMSSIEQRAANHIATLVNDDEKPKTIQPNDANDISPSNLKDLPNGSTEPETGVLQTREIKINGGSEKFATVNFLNETFEELIESSVDDGDSKDDKLIIDESPLETTEIIDAEQVASPVEHKSPNTSQESPPRTSDREEVKANGMSEPEGKMSAVTEDFLQNEKKYATLDSFFPLLSDIRFTGPASDMMSTSFQDSPTSPTSPECEQDSKPPTAADILKEWDSDSDSHSSNSSSGEFIWKDGDGHETSVVPTTHFEYQRGSGPPPSGAEGQSASGRESVASGASGASDGSGDSGSGSEGDEVEFVPSSWDCRAAPSKSSLRSLEQVAPDSKKRVVFKRQKYHCVYEYPREAHSAHSPAYLPDLSTYCEWDGSGAEEAELCYGQLFSSPSALGAAYPLRAGISFGSDYDEDFFISSSARPFESLGIMSTTSQFFPGGVHAKRALLEPAPAPATAAPPPPAPAPAPDLTTPDSGVEDITPGSTIDDDYKKDELAWRLDSASSSESVSPSSPGGEALGGLRHTRDKLKLDLPPSPHVPSPRHARVFNFVLDKPKRRDERSGPPSPLIMSDDTPVVAALPVPADDEPPPPEPTFSTFGKSVNKLEPEPKIILDEVEDVDESPKVAEAVKGEGTVLDSGDEDSGIESSSKATLERNTPNVS